MRDGTTAEDVIHTLTDEVISSFMPNSSTWTRNLVIIENDGIGRSNMAKRDSSVIASDIPNKKPNRSGYKPALPPPNKRMSIAEMQEEDCEEDGSYIQFDPNEVKKRAKKAEPAQQEELYEELELKEEEDEMYYIDPNQVHAPSKATSSQKSESASHISKQTSRNSCDELPEIPAAKEGSNSAATPTLESRADAMKQAPPTNLLRD